MGGPQDIDDTAEVGDVVRRHGHVVHAAPRIGCAIPLMADAEQKRTLIIRNRPGNDTMMFVKVAPGCHLPDRHATGLRRLLGWKRIVTHSKHFFACSAERIQLVLKSVQHPHPGPGIISPEAGAKVNFRPRNSSKVVGLASSKAAPLGHARPERLGIGAASAPSGVKRHGCGCRANRAKEDAP